MSEGCHGGLRKAAACAGFAAAAALSPIASADDALTTLQTLQSRPLPKPSAHIAYGGLPEQFAELWLPKGTGPFPLVLMIHGGCWQTNVATLKLMNYAAEDLRQRGIAVWNIEYRGIDRPGGGYPGTFGDVAQAADALRDTAKTYDLTLDNIVAVGHSAGGHLALWLAARPRLPAGSVLFVADPLPIATAVSLGGLPNLEMAHAVRNACGPSVIERLTGLSSSARPDIYAETSVDRLLPIGARQIVLSGREDPLVPPGFGAFYAAQAKKAGDAVSETVIPNAGHFDLIAPGTAAWEQEVAIIRAALHLTD